VAIGVENAGARDADEEIARAKPGDDNTHAWSQSAAH
jgi:hypothetical protein